MENLTARCMKCKKQVIIKDPVGKTTKNKMLIVGGFCPDCGTKVSRIVGKDKSANKGGEGETNPSP